MCVRVCVFACVCVYVCVYVCGCMCFRVCVSHHSSIWINHTFHSCIYDIDYLCVYDICHSTIMAHITHLSIFSVDQYLTHAHVQVSFRKRTAENRAIFLKFTCKDKTSQFIYGTHHQYVTHVKVGEHAYDAFKCRFLFAKELLNIELFCEKWPTEIRHPSHLRHSVFIHPRLVSHFTPCPSDRISKTSPSSSFHPLPSNSTSRKP